MNIWKSDIVNVCNCALSHMMSHSYHGNRCATLHFCSNPNILLSLFSLQQKHQAVEKEINGRGAHFRFTCQAGERLRKERHYAAKGIGTKIGTLQDKWKKLNELATSRTARLEEAVQYQQVRDSTT